MKLTIWVPGLRKAKPLLLLQYHISLDIFAVAVENIVIKIFLVAFTIITVN